ncbi:hypothetical protein [Brevundimonas sp.]
MTMGALAEIKTESGERLVINTDQILHMAEMGPDRTKVTFAVSDGPSLSTVVLSGSLTMVVSMVRSQLRTTG